LTVIVVIDQAAILLNESFATVAIVLLSVCGGYTLKVSGEQTRSVGSVQGSTLDTLCERLSEMLLESVISHDAKISLVNITALGSGRFQWARASDFVKGPLHPA
jgi:hypothetical protein